MDNIPLLPKFPCHSPLLSARPGQPRCLYSAATTSAVKVTLVTISFLLPFFSGLHTLLKQASKSAGSTPRIARLVTSIFRPILGLLPHCSSDTMKLEQGQRHETSLTCGYPYGVTCRTVFPSSSTLRGQTGTTFARAAAAAPMYSAQKLALGSASATIAFILSWSCLSMGPR